jgi:hypothetical protein
MRTTLVTFGIVVANLLTSFAKVACADEGDTSPPVSGTEEHRIVLDATPGAGSSSEEGAPDQARPPRGSTDPRAATGWLRWEPVAPGYHPSTRTRRGLVIAGVVVFGSAYLLSMLDAPLVNWSSFSFTSNMNTNASVGALFVPGVGPFIEIGQLADATWTPLLVLDGLAQLGGIAMIVVGLNAPKTVLVPNQVVASPGFEFSFAPIVTPSMQGLGLVGTF